MSKFRTPLSGVKGLGSSGDATHTFWLQRVTALALVPLTLWFIFSIACLPEASHADIVNWVKSPFNLVMLILTIIVSFYHGQIGIQVVLEDYISEYGIRVVSILAIKLLSFFLATLGVGSVLKIAFGA